jgi:hypothetical protein
LEPDLEPSRVPDELLYQVVRRVTIGDVEWNDNFIFRRALIFHRLSLHEDIDPGKDQSDA